MKTSMASKAGVVLLALILGACATKTGVVEDSGFLRDYSNLRETKDAQGKTIRAWVSPKLTPANYDAILLDPLVFYPEPRPTEQVSAETLQQVLAYSNDAIAVTQRAIQGGRSCRAARAPDSRGGHRSRRGRRP